MDPNEPPFRKLFGIGATQDATWVTIAKQDLPRLIALPENTAESIFVATVLRVADMLAAGNYINDPTGTVSIDIPAYSEPGTRQILITLKEKIAPNPDPNPAPPLPSQQIDPNKY